MSVILESLHRRKEPPGGQPVTPHQTIRPATDPAEPGVVGSARAGRTDLIYVLFLVIFAVCGWVLLEWLLASHRDLRLP